MTTYVAEFVADKIRYYVLVISDCINSTTELRKLASDLTRSKLESL